MTIGYSDEDGRINRIEITTPEVFFPISSYRRVGQVPLHCKMDAYILLDASHQLGKYKMNDAGWEEPVIFVEMVPFSGMKVNSQNGNGNKEFRVDDLVPGTRANRIVLGR